jgi:hypothetical protein
METSTLHLGTTPAKISSKDPLLVLMRAVFKRLGPDVTREQAVDAWRADLADHPDYEQLIDEIETYAANLLFNRCVSTSDAIQKRQALRAIDRTKKMREAIVSEVALATWVVPTVGKPLLDCTFAELAEAAPSVGRFLLRLSTQGAPGACVRDVFPDEDALQAFWQQALSG